MGSKKKLYDQTMLFTASQYVWWFFLGNIYFILLNLPLTTVILGLGMGIFVEPAPWFIAICCITLGPSLSALLGTMGKLLREKDISLTKDLFKYYKGSFKQSLPVWTIYLVIFTVLYMDILFFKSYNSALVYFFYVLFILVMVLSLTSLSIISRFYLSTKDTLKLTLEYSILNFISVLKNIVTLIAFAYVFFMFPSYSVIFMSGILAFAIMYNNRTILDEIEKRIKAAN